MIFTSTELVCPRGKDGDTAMVIDLKALLASETRQEEVAFVTPQKAPELLAEFNRSWRDIHKLVIQLSSELLQAQKAVQRRKAILLLEEVPKVLKSKGLTTNDANRDAIITLDDQFDRLQDKADQIKAVVEYLKGKLKTFENAYSSVKKIMGEDAYSMLARGSNPATKDGAPESPGFTREQSEPKAPPPGWGVPKYGS